MHRKNRSLLLSQLLKKGPVFSSLYVTDKRKEQLKNDKSLFAYTEREAVYMNPCELTASVTAVANVMASKLTDEELSIWAAVFVQLGDTLATIATQRARCKDRCSIE